MSFGRSRAALLWLAILAAVCYIFKAFGRAQEVSSVPGAVFAIGLGFLIAWLDDRAVRRAKQRNS